MFNLWNSGNQPNSTSIKEANIQMQAMHCRIVDLEQRVREQMELLDRRENENGARFNQMKAHKEGEVHTVSLELRKAEQKCERLEGLLKERDVQIAFLLHRYNIEDL